MESGMKIAAGQPGRADKVKLRLEGLDGNAFYLLGAFQAAAKFQGWSDEEIKAVFDEAQAGNYDHLLRTLMTYTEDPRDEASDFREGARRRAEEVQDVALEVAARLAALGPEERRLATEFPIWPDSPAATIRL
jgi:hypothetical protein